MKPFIAILLFIAMSGQMFQGDFIILDYCTHQQKYASLCVNKDKPEMHCNGRCQMHKKLQQVHQQERNHPEAANGFRVAIVLYCVLDNLHFNWMDSPVQKIKSVSIVPLLIDRDIDAIFHPPVFCA